MIRTLIHGLQEPIGPDCAGVARLCRQGTLGMTLFVLFVAAGGLAIFSVSHLLAWLTVCAVALGCAHFLPIHTRVHLVAHGVLLAIPWVALLLGALSRSTEIVQFHGLVLCIATSMAAGVFYRGVVLPVAIYVGVVNLSVVVFAATHWRPEFGGLALFGVCLGLYVVYGDRIGGQAWPLSTPQVLGDPVSGLANRRVFFETLRSHLDGTPCAILVFELEGLNSVNEHFGRQVGDALLDLTGRRIERLVGGEGIGARMGGDEFAVILKGDEQAACKLALDLAAGLSQPAVLNGRELQVNAAIGVALHPQHAESAAGLIRKANAANRRAKEDGESGVALYDPSLESTLEDMDPIAEALEAMIASGGPDVLYQPKIDLRTGALVGAEALVRWTHPTMGPLSPERFLAVAADRALIHPLTEQIFDRVVRDIRYWREHGTRFGRIALNIHPVDLKDPDHLMSLVEGLLVRDVGPDDVALEITEGCFVGRGREAAPEVLTEIAAMGFSLSLDDFGTGYAALTHLQSLPVGEVKIDKAFVENITTASGDRAIVEALVSMAKAYGLKTVAEGIERADQAAVLRTLGVDIGQGHYWASPVSAIAYETVADSLKAGIA